MVGREVSAQPPWSMAMSTITAPGFIALTVSAVMIFGAAAPGISTAAITRSLRRHRVSTTSRVEKAVRTRGPNWPAMRRSASGLRSSTVTLAPMPSAISAALVPDTPAPRTSTSAGGTPGHAADQDAAPAIGLLEAVGADLRRHAAGDLRHRRQQRQRAVRARHRLVRDRRDAGRDQVLRLLGVGREMQIGEQDLPAPQLLALGARAAPSP